MTAHGWFSMSVFVRNENNEILTKRQKRNVLKRISTPAYRNNRGHDRVPKKGGLVPDGLQQQHVFVRLVEVELDVKICVPQKARPTDTRHGHQHHYYVRHQRCEEVENANREQRYNCNVKDKLIRSPNCTCVQFGTRTRKGALPTRLRLHLVVDGKTELSRRQFDILRSGNGWKSRS